MNKLILSLFIIYAVSTVAAYHTCQPPDVKDPCFPKQYEYNHGETVSCAYPHKYF